MESGDQEWKRLTGEESGDAEADHFGGLFGRLVINKRVGVKVILNWPTDTTPGRERSELK